MVGTFRKRKLGYLVSLDVKLVSACCEEFH